jgi:hypothetical protein
MYLCDSLSDVYTKRFSAQETGILFVKPSANNKAVLAVISKVLAEHHVTIVSNDKLSGREVETRRIVEAQYPALEHFAHTVPACDIDMSPEELKSFRATFNAPWTQLSSLKKVMNANEACEYLMVHHSMLSALWYRSELCHRIRRGVYCARIDLNCSDDPAVRKLLKTPLFVVNGFYDSIRDSYINPDASINYLSVEWDGSAMSWSQLMQRVIGDSDPSHAQHTSIRAALYRDWKGALLYSEPTRLDNCIHMSCSAFEGLNERLIWTKGSMVFTDLFGSRLLAARFKSNMIKEWLTNPLVKNADNLDENLFAILDRMNSVECLEILSGLIAK